VVVDVADLRREARRVECRGAEQADLLLRREEQLDPGVLAPVLDEPRGRLEHRGDGGLVVRTEDRARTVADDLVLAHQGLDRSLGRHRVEMGTEEDRFTFARALEAAVDVPHRRADLGPRIVLGGLDPERL
jgi:hypothetical protein